MSLIAFLLFVLSGILIGCGGGLLFNTLSLHGFYGEKEWVKDIAKIILSLGLFYASSFPYLWALDHL